MTSAVVMRDAKEMGRTFRALRTPLWKWSRSLAVNRLLKSPRGVSRSPREHWPRSSAASAKSIDSMPSDAADVRIRLWPDDEPRRAVDDGRLFEEFASFLVRVGDPPCRTST